MESVGSGRLAGATSEVRVDVITIFPGMCRGFFDYGILHQGIRKGLFRLKLVDLREFTTDRHRTVDDRPYGGGEGMVLKPEPLFRAVERCRQGRRRPWVVYPSPQGTRFTQEKAVELSRKSHLTFICGRYEGVDQRALDDLVDEEICMGDFVVTGGELPALLMVDAVTRLIPGVVGKPASLQQESFAGGLLDYPQYTRPATFRGRPVPEVLLSGNHRAIRAWREQQALRRTRDRRPDLLTSGPRSGRAEM